jgi:hypothetical protein
MWKSLASSIPIIPIPGLWKLSAWNIFWSEGNNSDLANRILDIWRDKVRSLDNDGEKNLNALFEKINKKDNEEEVWWKWSTWSVSSKININQINTGKVKEWITEHINKNQKINLAQAEAIINNNANEKDSKIITWSTIQEKASQVIEAMNQIYNKEEQTKYSPAFIIEWISDIIKKDYNTWSIILDKENDKEKLSQFINDSNVKSFLIEEKNMLENILKNITYKDQSSTIYKLINKEWNIEWTTE